MSDRIQELVEKIKEKRELASLDDEYVRAHVIKALDEDARKKLEGAKDVEQFTRSKEFDTLRSEVRRTLRETYGVFSHEHMNKKELLTRLVNEQDHDTIIRQLLSTHQSTRERMPYYKRFYKELFTITGRPSKIFDLGCGLNPISYPFMGYEPRLSCADISTEDMRFLNTYFETMGLNGRAHAADALDEERIEKILKEENPEMVLLLKVVDTLETLKRHSSKKLLTQLARHASWIVVSFATVSLGGNKKIREEKRAWFEKHLKKEELEWKEILLPNEKAYVIRVEK